jgi:hypothetical protein
MSLIVDVGIIRLRRRLIIFEWQYLFDWRWRLLDWWCRRFDWWWRLLTNGREWLLLSRRRLCGWGMAAPLPVTARRELVTAMAVGAPVLVGR